jgi:hypothetical protein
MVRRIFEALFPDLFFILFYRANKVSLDSMGKGIFAQDFNTLSSISPSSVAPIAKIFESVAKESAGHFSRIIALLGQVMPLLRYLPTKGKRKRDMFSKEGRRIAKLLLEKADDEKVGDENDKLASSLLCRWLNEMLFL